MPTCAVVLNESESLHALTVLEHRTASVLGLLISKYCVCCRRRFSRQFCPPAVHATQGNMQSQKEGSFFTPIYDVLFWRILWFPFTQPTLPGNCSSPVSTEQQISSAAVPWICAWKKVWFCHLPHLGASPAPPGRVARDLQTTCISHHDLVPLVNRDTTPADWWDPVQEKVAGGQWFLEPHFLELFRCN